MYAFETQIILAIGLSISLVYVFNLFIRKLRLPMLIAPLIIGLLLNNNSFILVHIPEFESIIGTFASFGLIMIMFFIGLKVDFRFVKDLSKNSSIMALNAGHIPFFLGLFTTYLYTQDWIKSLFVGIALAITAEEVTIAVLDELKMLRKRVGQLIIEAGIIGDIFEIAAIAILGVFIKSVNLGSFSIVTLLIELMTFFIILILMRYIVLDHLLNIVGKHGRQYEYFGIALFTLLIMTTASELLNFSYIIGSLVAGLLLKDKLIAGKMYYQEHHIVDAIEVFNTTVFEPLVFIWIGLSLQIGILFDNIGFGIVLTVLALSGKILGSIIGNHFCHEPLSEGILIGWGLNARGATELFAILVAKNQGIITPDIFSAIVFMALVTTIVSPIVFKFMVLRGVGLVSHSKNRKKKYINYRIKKSI